MSGAIQSNAIGTVKKPGADELDRFLISPELMSLEQALGGFNMFQTLGIIDKELFHSRLLAWLLEPNQSHGLGDLFLRRWLMRIVAENLSENPRAPSVVQIDVARWVEFDVQAEVVFDSGGRIDVQVRLLERTPSGERCWWVAIETKVGATQSENQLGRYRSAVERKAHATDLLVFVFLTRDSEPPADDHWYGAAFGSVHATLLECLEMRSQRIAPGPAMLMRDYSRTLESHFMPDSTVADRVRAIFEKHPEAMAAIEANWPKPDSEIMRHAKEMLETKQVDLGITVLPSRARNYFRFVRNDWKTPTGSPEVVCWVDFTEFEIGIRIFATPECEETKRKKLMDAAKSAPFRKGRKSAKSDVEWPTLHSMEKKPLGKANSLEKRKAEAARVLGEDVASTEFNAVCEKVRDVLSAG